MIINIRNINEQRVDVQPVVNIITPDGEYREHAPILSVPVMFPATKTSALTFEVSVGDTVLCMFSSRCIDAFKSSGGIVNPLDLRRFDQRDAVAILGIFPFNKAINNPSAHKWSHNTTDTVLVHNLGTANEVEVRLKKDGGITINTNKAVEVNCNTATVNATSTTLNSTLTVNGNTTVNGNITCSQTVTATTDVVGGGKSLKNHIHGAVPGAPVAPVVCVNGNPWTGTTQPPT
jgi:phage baseplate assembly protein gpV